MPELPNGRRERRRPPRCRCIHPWVEEATALRIETRARMIGCAPEQLASYIIERVMSDPALEQRIGL